MLRAVTGVIGGYLITALSVTLGLLAAYHLMGAGVAFKPGTFEASGLWILTSFVVGLGGAAAGGFFCAAVTRGGRPPQLLAALVLVLGVLVAVPVVMSGGGGRRVTRGGDVPFSAALQNVSQPGWVALANPLLGAAGVLLGVSLRGRRGARRFVRRAGNRLRQPLRAPRRAAGAAEK